MELRELLAGADVIEVRGDPSLEVTALAYDMPVVTANLEHFRRVPHLEVESY